MHYYYPLPQQEYVPAGNPEMRKLKPVFQRYVNGEAPPVTDADNIAAESPKH